MLTKSTSTILTAEIISQNRDCMRNRINGTRESNSNSESVIKNNFGNQRKKIKLNI